MRVSVTLSGGRFGDGVAGKLFGRFFVRLQKKYRTKEKDGRQTNFKQR